MKCGQTHTRVISHLWHWGWCVVLCKAILLLALLPGSLELGSPTAEIAIEQTAFSETRAKVSDVQAAKLRPAVRASAICFACQREWGDLRGARRRLASGWVVPLRC